MIALNKLFRHSIKVAALTILVGALPFLSPAHAQDSCRWLDDYRKSVKLEYGADVSLQTNYLWRGMYLGGLSVQGSVNVGYGGLYVDMWWNLGVPDYSFRAFQPEMDLTVGFRRWGLDLSAMYVHNFNCGFFDFNNYAPGLGGNGLEVRARYTVSSKLPLSVLWATRVSAKDGYLNTDGELVRAWSSYLELSYTHHFAHDISLYGAIAMTPWRSMYTAYTGGATITNIELKCWKEWVVDRHCGVQLAGGIMINPYYMANPEAGQEEYNPYALGSPQLNANIGVKVFLIQ